MSVAQLVAVAALYGGGIWLVLSRSLLRVTLGVTLLGHGSVLLLVASGGRAGDPAFVGDDAPSGTVTDPVPQALGLTAVVITFAVVAFLLALSWRARAELGSDRIVRDREDLRIAAEASDPS